MALVRLKPGREQSVLRRHPWVFSGAVAQVQGEPQDGDTVQVQSAAGDFLAWGAYSGASQIRLRLWSWKQADRVDEAFIHALLERSIKSRRSRLNPLETDSLRLVHGESDGLPGVVIDQYGETLVMQLLSTGAEHWRETIAQTAMQLSGAQRVYERSDADVRLLEGLPERCGPVLGSEPPEHILITENGMRYKVDVRQGHKTGFYLDQRSNRARLRFLASGRKVLDCFCYTGGFLVNALAGGAASVAAVDSSASALAMAQENLALNGFSSASMDWIEEDVFKVLRGLRDRRAKFDMIILDPPKFAPTAAQAQKAARGYKDINLLALKLLAPGGLLVTFSCSGGVSPDLFQKIVAGAAQDALVDAQILEVLSQASDHPVGLNFPEGAYLKGLIVQVL
jgi:23S rRNA (cytosine1962-C5)-methyltransferase